MVTLDDIKAARERVKPIARVTPLIDVSGIATAHASAARDDINRFLSRPAETFRKTDPLPTPPGEPIGGRGGR